MKRSRPVEKEKGEEYEKIKEEMHELDLLNVKHAGLDIKIRKTKEKLINAETQKSINDTRIFINNTHKGQKFQPLRNRQEVSPLVATTTTTIFECLCLPEMASQICIDMGPCELFMLGRVSRLFKNIVVNVFKINAKGYLARYMENVKDEKTITEQEKITASCLVMLDKTVKANKVPVNAFLSLWCHIMRVRQAIEIDAWNRTTYCGTSEDRPGKLHNINYLFKFDPETRVFRRARDLDLYTTPLYKQIARRAQDRWDRKYNFSFESHDRVIGNFFRYDDLSKLDLVRVDQALPVINIAEALEFKNNSLVKFKEVLCGFCYCAPYSGDAASLRSDPFIDYYDVRLALNARNNKRQFRDTISSHLARVENSLVGYLKSK